MAGYQEVFRAPVTETYASTLLSDIGAQSNVLRVESDQREYRLVQAGASIADGALVQLDSVSASLGSIVETVHNSRVPIFGVLQAGQSVSALGFFWCMVNGSASVRSVDVGTDLSMAQNVAVCLNSDGALNSVQQIATTIDPQIVFGQLINSVTIESDAAVTAAIKIVGIGA